MVIEIEKNWSNPKGYCTASQDIYILEGDLTVGNEKMISGCYSFIPKGTAYGPLRSEKGCRALVFFGSPYDFGSPYYFEVPDYNARRGACTCTSSLTLALFDSSIPPSSTRLRKLSFPSASQHTRPTEVDRSCVACAQHLAGTPVWNLVGDTDGHRVWHVISCNDGSSLGLELLLELCTHNMLDSCADARVYVQLCSR